MLFLLELPWCCFMCRKQKFSECPENPQRHFLENIKITGERIKTRGPTPCPRGWGRAPSPWARPPVSWAPWGSADLNSNYIYSLSRRKKSERKFHRVLRYGAAAKPESLLGGLIWSPFGAPERGICRRRHINHPPSPISWCSPSCVSNSIVGLLDGDGLDEIYHVIELVLLGIYP